jgi:hypothetical protein
MLAGHSGSHQFAKRPTAGAYLHVAGEEKLAKEPERL